jgi:hypothetical protein
MKYIENNTIGIIALIRRNNAYEYNALDSSYCALSDYEKEIENEEYFGWIKDTKMILDLMIDDFNQISKIEDKKIIENYLRRGKPNIIIDFDSKFLANHYYDRPFEGMVPNSWKGIYIDQYMEFTKYIPIEFQYWNQCEILIDYLQQFSTALQINKELNLIEKVLEVSKLHTYDQRWDYFEKELGGNILSNKEYGWISLENYRPNLVMNRETKNLFLSYLLEAEFEPKYKVEIEQVKKLLIHEKRNMQA